MSPFADILITNAHVFSAQPEQPFAEAVAVKGNRIVFVGSMRDAAEWRGSSTREIDAGNGTVMPGFIDSHFHLLSGSLNLDDIHLENVTSYEGFLTTVQDYAARHPEKHWLAGYGLQYSLGPGAKPMDRPLIDKVVASRPVIIYAYDYHTAWANTRALKEAGLFHGGDCGLNNQILLDEQGEATGELREGASDLIDTLLPQPDLEQKRSLLKKGLRLAARFGITSVHEMEGNDEQTALFTSLEQAGEMTARVYCSYSLSPDTPFESIEKEAAVLKEKYQTNMVHGGSVKLFMDGVIEAYTGLLVEQYADLAGTHGGSNYEVEHFNRMVVEADRLGLQVCAHSVGDLGVRRVLNAYEKACQINGKRDSRHRIEHTELVHPEDVHRFSELGVIASMQPLHAPLNTEKEDVWLDRVGPQRWPFSFAWSTLRECGAVLVFGSDWPVVSQNPMLGISATQNRKPWLEGHPRQTQNLSDALLSYTRYAAFAEFQELRKGQLAPGFLADIILLSGDIFHTPAEDLAMLRPLMTMVDGRIVFDG